jgi:hypothetical protein
MYKPRIEVIFGNERIISPSGLDIVGAMLGKSDFPGTPRMCFKLLFPALFSRNAPAILPCIYHQPRYTAYTGCEHP